MPPRPQTLRQPTRKAASLLPPHARFCFLSEASAAAAAFSPDLARHLGAAALSVSGMGRSAAAERHHGTWPSSQMPKHSMAQHGPHFHQQCSIPQASSMLICIACVHGRCLRSETLVCCVFISRLLTTLVRRYPGERLCSTARCAACTSTLTPSPGVHAALHSLRASAPLGSKCLLLPFSSPFHSCIPLHCQALQHGMHSTFQHSAVHALYVIISSLLTTSPPPPGHAKTFWHPLAPSARPSAALSSRPCPSAPRSAAPQSCSSSKAQAH